MDYTGYWSCTNYIIIGQFSMKSDEVRVCDDK